MEEKMVLVFCRILKKVFEEAIKVLSNEEEILRIAGLKLKKTEKRETKKIQKPILIDFNLNELGRIRTNLLQLKFIKSKSLSQEDINLLNSLKGKFLRRFSPEEAKTLILISEKVKAGTGKVRSDAAKKIWFSGKRKDDSLPGVQTTGEKTTSKDKKQRGRKKIDSDIRQGRTHVKIVAGSDCNNVIKGPERRKAKKELGDRLRSLSLNNLQDIEFVRKELEKFRDQGTLNEFQLAALDAIGWETSVEQLTDVQREQFIDIYKTLQIAGFKRIPVKMKEEEEKE